MNCTACEGNVRPDKTCYRCGLVGGRIGVGQGRLFSIGDKMSILREFTCTDYAGGEFGPVTTLIRVGDTGTVVGTDSDRVQVRMETGDYSGIVTNVELDSMSKT